MARILRRTKQHVTAAAVHAACTIKLHLKSFITRSCPIDKVRVARAELRRIEWYWRAASPGRGPCTFPSLAGPATSDVTRDSIAASPICRIVGVLLLNIALSQSIYKHLTARSAGLPVSEVSHCLPRHHDFLGASALFRDVPLLYQWPDNTVEELATVLVAVMLPSTTVDCRQCQACSTAHFRISALLGVLSATCGNTGNGGFP